MNALLAALMNGAIASGLTTAMIWIALHLVPRRALNAATRYAIWWAAMAIALGLPLFFIPASRSEPPAVVSYNAPVAISIRVPDPIPAPRTTASSASPSFRLPSFPIAIPGGRWTRWILAAWVATAILLLVRLIFSFVLLYRIRARASEIRGNVRNLRATDEIATPVAVGPWRRTILIPVSLFEELEAADLAQIEMHEAAHFARGDDYALIVQRLIEALFAVHPVVRWITRRLDLEREIACDDRVIAATGNPVCYAECLVRIVELSAGVRSSLTAVAAAEDSSQLARRVDVLLDNRRHTGTRLLKAQLVAMIAISAVVAIAAERVSGVVAFARPFAPVRKTVATPPVAKVTLLPQQAVAPDSESPFLSGRVLEDSSGNPVAAAELRFHKAGMHELAADLETDRQGNFTAPGLPPGDYTVDAVKPNFVTTTFKLHVPSGSPLIRLVRYGVIDGQVMDAQGKPLPGRILEPHGRTAGATRVAILVRPAGSEELNLFREAYIEDAGHYRAYDLPPGEYAVGIWYTGLNDGSGMQLYPDDSHPRFFTVQGGEEYNNINFVVVARPAWRVSGKVLLPEGVKGQFQLALGLPERPTLPVGQALAENDGTFHFEKIPAGTYDLFAAGPTGGYAVYESILGKGQPFFGRVRINVSAQNLEDVSVPVAAGRAMKVVLRPSGAGGIPDGCAPKATVVVASIDPWGTVFSSRTQVEFGKEQTIGDLAPGRFRVDATDLGTGCFQVNRPMVDLGAEAAGPVAVELASAGSIRGVAHGAGFAVVLLDAAATNGAQARVAYPETDGRFVFEGLRPGHYRIAKQLLSDVRSRWVSPRGTDIEVAGGIPTKVDLP